MSSTPFTSGTIDAPLIVAPAPDVGPWSVMLAAGLSVAVGEYVPGVKTITSPFAALETAFCS
jgi:hypothetical protein